MGNRVVRHNNNTRRAGGDIDYFFLFFFLFIRDRGEIDPIVYGWGTTATARDPFANPCPPFPGSSVASCRRLIIRARLRFRFCSAETVFALPERSRQRIVRRSRMWSESLNKKFFFFSYLRSFGKLNCILIDLHGFPLGPTRFE